MIVTHPERPGFGRSAVPARDHDRAPGGLSARPGTPVRTIEASQGGQW